jgi:glycosyltransferase involved in cell wall biosynthesis
MRIAHFLLGRCNPESANGIDKAVYYLSRTQGELGHDVGVFSITNKPPIAVPGAEVKTFPPRLPPVPLPPGRLGDLLGQRSPMNLSRTLVRGLIDWQPDIVHFHFVHIPQAIRLARRLSHLDIPYCVSLHGGLARAALERRRVAKQIFSLLVERRYLNGAAFIHAVSSLDADGAGAYGVRNRMIIAPNCIDPAARPSEVDRGVLQTRFPQLRGRRVFLYLGRLDAQQKGLDLLVRAWADIEPRDGLGLVLVGPNWRGGRTQLEGIARTAGTNVIFAGPVSGRAKWELLAGADVFVHPSRWEAGVPFAVLETMLATRPVLVTGPADPDGVIRSAEAGLVVDPDAESIAAGIRAMANLSSKELRAMGRRARTLVDQAFRWERTAGILLSSYRDSIVNAFPGRQ